MNATELATWQDLIDSSMTRQKGGHVVSVMETRSRERFPRLAARRAWLAEITGRMQLESDQ